MRFPRPFVLATPLLAALALGACGDSTAPSPRLRAPSAPTSLLSDGSRTGGNPDFFFLPPIVGNPSSDPDFSPGQFAGSWKPVVEVCEVSAADLSAGCLTPVTIVRTYSGSAVAVSTTDEQYQVQVDTKESWAVAGRTYRFTVSVVGNQSVPLGFVDIALLTGSAKNAGTGDLVVLQDGRTIPLRFRIEKGATVPEGVEVYSETVVTDAGATVLTGGTGGPGTFALQLPPDFLPPELSEVVITVERVNIASGNPCTESVPNLIQSSDCWRITSYPSIPRVTQDLTVAFCPAIAPTDPRYDAQAMYKFDAPETLQELHGVATPLVNCNPSGQIGALERKPGMLGALQYGLASIGRGLSKAFGPNTAYAIDIGWGGRIPSSEEEVDGGVFSDFFWAIPLRIDVVSGDGQSGYAGFPLAQPLRVRVTGAHVHEDEGDVPIGIPNVAVTTSLVSNGNLAPTSVMTDASGFANFGFTPINAGTGSATMNVSGLGAGTFATFNVSAVAPIATGVVASCGANYASGGDQVFRGFHMANYPGSSIEGVQVHFNGTASQSYTVRMTAYDGSYGGAVLGTNTVTFTMPTAGNTYMTFAWTPAAVTPGHTVAFRMENLAEATSGILFYNVSDGFPPNDDPSCPITETEDTSAPLSTPRRQGVEAIIFATLPVIG